MARDGAGALVACSKCALNRAARPEDPPARRTVIGDLAFLSQPALTGAWRWVGGGLLQLPLWAFPVNWPALLHPELATPGTRVVNQFLLGRGR